MDLSEIQEENAIQVPVQNLEASDRRPELELPKALQSARNREIYLIQQRLKKDEERKIEEARLLKIKEETIKKFFAKYDSKRISHYIPAMHMPYTIGSSKVMIYYHANAEDIVLCNELLDYVRALLKINIIAIEYPGYGLYTEKLQTRTANIAQHRFFNLHHNYPHQTVLGGSQSFNA